MNIVNVILVEPIVGAPRFFITVEGGAVVRVRADIDSPLKALAEAWLAAHPNA